MRWWTCGHRGETAGQAAEVKVAFEAERCSVSGARLAAAKLAASREHVTHLPGTLAAFLFQNCFLVPSLDIFPPRLQPVLDANTRALSWSARRGKSVYLQLTKTQRAAMLPLPDGRASAAVIGRSGACSAWANHKWVPWWGGSGSCRRHNPPSVRLLTEKLRERPPASGPQNK